MILSGLFLCRVRCIETEAEPAPWRGRVVAGRLLLIQVLVGGVFDAIGLPTLHGDH